MTDFAARLLELAQQGLPLVPRPFQALAEQLGVTERCVIDTFARLQAQGIIREFSAFLDPQRLGYHSSLACMKVPAERVDDVAAMLQEMPEVTHNYLRDHEWNMWFTVIAPSETAIQAILGFISEQTGCGPIHNLPAETMYKIRVAFRADEMAP